MNYNVKVTSSEEDIKNGRMMVEIDLTHMVDEMIIEAIGQEISQENLDKLKEKYPHNYIVNWWAGRGKMKRIYSWFDDMGIKFVHANRAFFFTTDEDKLLFMMRWGCTD
jgi:hypothetical protein